MPAEPDRTTERIVRERLPASASCGPCRLSSSAAAFFCLAFGFALAFGFGFGLGFRLWPSAFGLGFDFAEAGAGGAARRAHTLGYDHFLGLFFHSPFLLAGFFVVERPIPLRPRYRVATPSVPPSG